jgi:hypothetical protein
MPLDSVCEPVGAFPKEPSDSLADLSQVGTSESVKCL